ncbi:hypothetical protein AB0L75_22900 [Streptomyces sp. NPDC052101]|uniref:hypothetical protein n=1 Tax=Streptomyces sp. NPDC052101 TaxID=3155763 RepID=UPI00342D0DCD
MSEAPESPDAADSAADSLEKRRLAQEAKDERKVWYFLGYFLFGIHIVAFVMIYAVRHGH